jgi:ubiquitin-protein ligase
MRQVRRITAEWKEICNAGLSMAPGVGGTRMGNATDQVRLMPHPRNIFEWHFTFAGPPGTDYEGGLYHGKIILPGDYPNSAPSVRLMTPNGR